MESMMRDFLELLFLEKAVHEELVALAAKKKDVLIENDISVLGEIVAQERTLLKKIKELETKREITAGEMSEVFNVGKDRITLDEIEKHAAGELKARISKIKEELISVVSALAGYNAINMELIKTHLDYTYFSLDMMTQTGISADTYDNSGYMKESGKNRIGLIDQKA